MIKQQAALTDKTTSSLVRKTPVPSNAKKASLMAAGRRCSQVGSSL
jgi:hypothetical protein